MASSFPYLDSNSYFTFPPAAVASAEGIVGHGANLSPGLLNSAYRQGVFPWFSEEDPILWWSPDPRFVLKPDHLHLPRSFRRFLKRCPYRFTADGAFSEVITGCSEIPRPDQDGTWITPGMIDAYLTLHELGIAHSIEVWRGERLVGGLYGVSIGSVFAGESMFNLADNASKSGLAVLCGLLATDREALIDCQVYTPHIAALGGEEIRRSEYLAMLKRGLNRHRLELVWSDRFDPQGAIERVLWQTARR